MAALWRGKAVRNATQLAWHKISVVGVDRIRNGLKEKYHPVTANRCLTALRRVLKEEWRAGRLSHEQFERLVDFAPIRGDSLPGKAARKTEVERLLDACEHDRSPAGVRDAAIIAVLYAAGLRRAETSALTMDDFLQEGEIAVLTKGGGITVATLGAAAPWVDRWLAVRGREPGPLFLQIRATGKIAQRPLGPSAINAVVGKRAKEAGIDHVSAHMLRRGFATELLRRGYDHLLVARALRHKDMRSVQRYDGMIFVLGDV